MWSFSEDLEHPTYLCSLYHPAGTWRLYNVGSTSMQRHDIASTLRWRCINVMCPLGRLFMVRQTHYNIIRTDACLSFATYIQQKTSIKSETCSFFINTELKFYAPVLSETMGRNIKEGQEITDRIQDDSWGGRFDQIAILIQRIGRTGLSKSCRPRSDAAVWSKSKLFALTQQFTHVHR